MSSFVVFIIVMAAISIAASKRKESLKTLGKNHPIQQNMNHSYEKQRVQQQQLDILQKAMRNVKNAVSHEQHNRADDEENCDHVERIFDSEQEKERVAAVKTENVDLSWSDGTELMDEIQNLIVCGYDGNLEFERDFVSEGLEMLNNMELQ